MQPTCRACGSAKRIEVHHLIPVHVMPKFELDEINLITLCERCHLIFGHLGDWESWNVNCREDVELWAGKIRTRPYHTRGTA